jgi:phospholipid/cholesterol/gamma-HCH transport system substrate-binding protein
VTIARGAAAGAIVVALVVVAVLLLSSGGQHTYHLLFQNAGQLVKDDDVQIGGRRVGSVQKIELTNDNLARITIGVDDAFAPLHQGTTAIIRATSLSGIANRYISLTPGPDSSLPIPDGGTLQTDKTTSPVDLDQVFDTLDPKTRAALQQFIRGSGAWYDNVGKQANLGAKYFNPAISTTQQLVAEILRDQQTFNDFLVHSSRTVTALAARRDDITNLVTNANTTAAAIGAEDSSLARALGLLPDTLRKANTTFVNLRATLGDLNTLVNVSKPVAPKLAPFFSQLRPLVTEARPTIHDLALLIHRSGSGNDLTDLLNKTPHLESLAKPTFAHSIAALRQTDPVLEFVRPYTPDLVGWVRDFGQGASNYDANGHFARIQPMVNAFSFTDNAAGGTLTPLTPAQRQQTLQANVVRRCPGAASQPPSDGSAPWRDASGALDCDTTLVPPGP